MDYSIANFILRTEGKHSDIAACGLRGFRNFEVEYNPDVEATMLLRMDSEIDEVGYSEQEVVHSFEFEQQYATGELIRFNSGYIFAMQRNEERYVMVKHDDSSVVESNLGLVKRVNPSLVRFGIWIMFGIVMAPLGGILIHSSVVVKDGGAVLCLGESGTGKSTHTRLWIENIESSKLLNDDSPVVRMVDGVATVFGSPWSGKTHYYVAENYPIRGFMRLSQAPYNKISKLPILMAIGALLPSCPPAFAYDDRLQDCICNTLSNMISVTPVYHLECLPNSEAAQLSYSTIYGN